MLKEKRPIIVISEIRLFNRELTAKAFIVNDAQFYTLFKRMFEIISFNKQNSPYRWVADHLPAEYAG
jgi:hypothetical protein